MPPDPFIAACVQLNASSDRALSLAQAADFVAQAAGQGAKLIVTPENTCGLYNSAQDRLHDSVAENAHPGLALFSDLAQKHSVFLLAGSLAVKVEGNRLANRSYLFAPDGRVCATYDKIHLFDVDLPNGDKYRESDSFVPGQQAVMAHTPLATLGLTICYDVRFPQLYRALAKAGAEVMLVPAAFTVPTGQAHWEVLLRARAIECGAYVLAPAQTGTHNGTRETYGHSMIISPWGEILAQADCAVGVITAQIDLQAVRKARAAIPALTHDRNFTLKETS